MHRPNPPILLRRCRIPGVTTPAPPPGLEPSRPLPGPLRALLPRDTSTPLLLTHPRAFAARYRWALVWLVLGASADVFTTLWNLRELGPGVEVHPPQRLLSEWLGVEAGVPLAKAVQLAFVVLVAAWWRPWCRPILLLCGTLYALAAMSNYWRWL